VEFDSREDDQEVKVDRVKFHRKLIHIRKMKLEQLRNRNLRQVQLRNHMELELASLEPCKELVQVRHSHNRQQQVQHSHNRHHQLTPCDL
jgi:hypothetical protein